MRIERVRLVNWMPFADEHVLELPPGPIAVVATYDDDATRSNWAGKTAFLEAIRWCLFGWHRKRLDDDVVFEGADATSVEVTLAEGEYRWDVVRVKARGKSTTLRIVEMTARGRETGVHASAVTEYEKNAAVLKLAELLGVGLSDYETANCFRQGDAKALVARTSGERRETIVGWLGLARWEALDEIAAADVRKAREALLAVGPDEEVPDVQELRARLVEAEEAHEATVGLVERSEATAEAEGIRHSLEKEIAEARLHAEFAVQVEAFREEAESAQALAVQTSAETASARAEYARACELAAGDFDGACPVMRRPCPAADAVRNATRGNEAMKVEARKALDEKSLISERAVDAARDARTSLGKVEGHVRDVKQAAARAKELRAKLEGLPTAGEGAVVDPAQARTMLHTAVSRLAEARTAVEAGIAAEKRQAARVSRRRDAALELEAVLLARRAVSPDGIPADLAVSESRALEREVAVVLGGTGLAVRLAWDRELRELTRTCVCGEKFRSPKTPKECPVCGTERSPRRRRELEILVTDESGVEEDAAVKSEGAQTLVAAALRLAAASLLRRRRGSRVAWAEVDEPFGPLDERNRALLASTFGGMLSAAGLEQAFVVSHDAGLLDALPHRILVTRHGDRSTVEVG